MKKLALLATLLFSVMFSSASYAEWTKVDADTKGNTFYVDFERIRKVDGYVYFWDLADFLKPINKYLSAKLYRQGDCKLFRYKDLMVIWHKNNMGRGTSDNFTPPEKWKYPPPNSTIEIVLSAVCSL